MNEREGGREGGRRDDMHWMKRRTGRRIKRIDRGMRTSDRSRRRDGRREWDEESGSEYEWGTDV